MKIPAFKLEEFWKKYEFSSPYLFCPSDAEPFSLKELFSLADEESLKLWENLQLSYTESPGFPLLREQIAKLYPGLNADDILTTAGAEEGIYCTLRTLLSPGDHVVALAPCYQSLETLPRVIGAEITLVNLDPLKQWKLDLNQFKSALRPNTKAIILNIPHNPTGSLLDKETFDEIVELARKRGSYIFCDEVYRYLEVEESKRLPAIAEAYEKGISLNVMTKSFGLAGLRIGWLASKDRQFIHDVGSYKLYTSICNSAPSEILALIALQAKEHIFKRNRSLMLKNLELLDRFFEKHGSKFSWKRPESGMMALVQLLLPIDVDQFTTDLVEQSGVLIMPGSVFDLPGNFFRIGFGRRNMPQVLEHFERFVNQ